MDACAGEYEAQREHGAGDYTICSLHEKKAMKRKACSLGKEEAAFNDGVQQIIKLSEEEAQELKDDMLAGGDPLGLQWTQEMITYVFERSAFAKHLFTGILPETLHGMGYPSGTSWNDISSNPVEGVNNAARVLFSQLEQSYGKRDLLLYQVVRSMFKLHLSNWTRINATMHGMMGE